jgi:hypothetical protein
MDLSVSSRSRNHDSIPNQPLGCAIFLRTKDRQGLATERRALPARAVRSER